MLMFDTVVQTQFGSFFKAFALPTDVKPTTGVAPGSKIEEFNPATGAVDTYRWNGSAWAKIDSNGIAAGSVPSVAAADKGKFLHANDSTGAVEWAEGGSGGGVLEVTMTITDTEGGRHAQFNKTWQEIHDAPMAVIKTSDGDCCPVEKVFTAEGDGDEVSLTYCVQFVFEKKRYTATAGSASGRPEFYPDSDLDAKTVEYNILKADIMWGPGGGDFNNTVRELLGADVVLLSGYGSHDSYWLLSILGDDEYGYTVKFAIYDHDNNENPPVPYIYVYTAFANSLDSTPTFSDSDVETIPASS